MISDSLHSELPFATLNDETLREIIGFKNKVNAYNNLYDFSNVVFDPLIAENDKYDKANDETNFFNIVDIPQTQYVILTKLTKL